MKSVVFSIAVLASAFALTASATAQKNPGTTNQKKYQYV